MYTGTCAWYDANNSEGDGNTGWACYDKQEVTYLLAEEQQLDEFDMEFDLDAQMDLTLF